MQTRVTEKGRIKREMERKGERGMREGGGGEKGGRSDRGFATAYITANKTFYA